MFKCRERWWRVAYRSLHEQCYFAFEVDANGKPIDGLEDFDFAMIPFEWLDDLDDVSYDRIDNYIKWKSSEKQ